MANYSCMRRAPTREFGLTIIELMVVIAIISILLVIAVPVYQQYSSRAKVTEGLNLAAPILNGVAEYRQTNSKWPENNSDAGASTSTDYETDFVEKIEVSANNPDGTITITYKPAAITGITSTTNTLIYTPSIDSASTVTWECDGGTLADWARPSRCR